MEPIDRHLDIEHGPWRTRYEDLRCGVLEDPYVNGKGYGLSLFIQRGLVTWMRTWPNPELAPAPRPEHPSLDCPVLPQRFHQEVATLWANMVLGMQPA